MRMTRSVQSDTIKKTTNKQNCNTEVKVISDCAVCQTITTDGLEQQDIVIEFSHINQGHKGQNQHTE